MALLSEWHKKAEENQSGAEGRKFWNDYFNSEKEFYKKILVNKPKENTVKGFADFFDADIIMMTAYLDGINDSLKKPNDIENMEEDTKVNLDYDIELLYKNMVEAKADWLYNLPEWDMLLTAERRKELYKEQKNSKTVVKAEKIGRNDPCPCGSGKKYKKCHGRDVE